jgi:uncharacterized membrane protein YphA (DoxX/SURF4 family)
LKLGSFLFSDPWPSLKYALVIPRLVIAYFWLVSDGPRWVALAAGHPATNGLVRALFGADLAMPLTYVFTLFETLGAIALILGLFTRLVAIWPVVEFAITGTFGVVTGSGLFHDYAICACGLVLLFTGSPALSVDSLLAKRWKQ